MLWSVTAIDRTTLPTALLPMVKSHCRVDFTDDDTILTTYISIAIGQLENVWDLAVFGVDGKWQPTITDDLALPIYETPVQPAKTFTAKDGADADVSANYELINTVTYSEPSYFRSLDGTPIAADIKVALKGGYAAATDMPPEMLGAILQVSARLYEFRESSVSFSVNQMPMWMNDLLVGLWQPRA